MIRLSEAHEQSIRAHGASEFPRECCGVLLGDLDAGVKRVTEVRGLPNTFVPSEEFEQSVAGSATPVAEAVGQERRFMVSPDAMLSLMREERQTGRKVLGFYHSHPNHPALPSEYDRVWAMPWYSYMIVSVQDGSPAELTCWQLADDGDRFECENVERC